MFLTDPFPLQLCLWSPCHLPLAVIFDGYELLSQTAWLRGHRDKWSVNTGEYTLLTLTRGNMYAATEKSHKTCLCENTTRFLSVILLFGKIACLVADV